MWDGNRLTSSFDEARHRAASLRSIDGLGRADIIS
jgi:hypothetical protein